jgi:hypothetical protein
VRIAGVEVISAVTRRQRSGSLTPSEAALLLGRFRQDFATQYRIVAITPALLDQAMALAETHALRGYCTAARKATAMEWDHASGVCSHGMVPV